MPIRTSSAREVDTLLADLRSSDAVTRDAAIARLTVIGARAIDRLRSLIADSTSVATARAAALRTLEGIADPRALTPALEVVRAPLGRRRAAAEAGPDDEIAIAAIAVARGFLQSSAHVEALDALTAVALNRRWSEPVRVAALRALGALDSTTLRPIREALLTDASPRLRAFAQGGTIEPGETAPSGSWLDRPGEHAMPEDPDNVRHEIERRAAAASLPVLHSALETIRDRELRASPSTRRGWRAARAAVHEALAYRGSRVGLYDLRELLEAADGPVVVPLITAVGLIGDDSCLEPLAGLYARARSVSAAETWRDQVVEAFRAIVTRERITARHAVARKIKSRWPAQWSNLYLPPARSTERF